MKVDIHEAVAFDATKMRKTPEGYLAAAPLVARTGIQLYKGKEFGHPEMDSVRLYRPEEEVFSKDSLASFAHIPVTNDHPPTMVDAKNWKRYSAGMTSDEILRDGERIRVPLVIMDAALVTDVEGGKRELSMGYGMDVEWSRGETPKGEAYDAIARNIRCNHVAVVDTARGGPELRIGDQAPRESVVLQRDRQERTENMEKTLKTVVIDSVSVEMTDIAAQMFDRYRATTEKALADTKAELLSSAAKVTQLTDASTKAATDAKAALDAKDGEIAAFKKEIADLKAASTPAAIDARVKDRAALVDRAKKLMPQGLVVDGKTDAEIRRQVVDAKLGAAANGKSDDYVQASFDTLAASVPDHLARVLSDATPHSSQDARDQAYNKMTTDMEAAWKGQTAAH